MLKKLINYFQQNLSDANWSYLFLIGAGGSRSYDLFTRTVGRDFSYQDYGSVQLQEFSLVFQVMENGPKRILVCLLVWPPYGYENLSKFLKEPDLLCLFFQMPDFEDVVRKLRPLMSKNFKSFECNTFMFIGATKPNSVEPNERYEAEITRLVTEIWAEFQSRTGLNLSTGWSVSDQFPSDLPYLKFLNNLEPEFDESELCKSLRRLVFE